LGLRRSSQAFSSASFRSTSADLRARRTVLAFAAVTLLLLPVAYTSLFSVFSAYDDEGYFLMTLRDYLSGEPLYTQVSTLYGPFFYEVTGALFKLFGLEPGSDSARAVTLVAWLLASLGGGLVAYRLTRSLLLGLSGQFVTFHVLASLTSEPLQPAGLLSLLLVGLAAAAAYRSMWPRATAVLIGAVVAAACLIKINVGIFAGLAVAFAFAASLGGRWRFLLTTVSGHLLVVVPFALMAPMLGQEWVFEYALVVALSAWTVVLVCLYGPRSSSSPPAFGWLAAGALAAAVPCLGIAILGGTNPSDIFGALVVIPARLSQLYVWPLRINSGYVISAAVLMVVVLILGSRARRGLSPAIPGLARIGVGLFTWLAVLLLPSSLFFLALPLAFLAAVDPRRDGGDPALRYARLLLPALAVVESLQAYPIAGTQLSMAALLLVPVGAITLNDGIVQLREWATGEARGRLLAAVAWVAPAMLIANVAFYQLSAFLAVSGFAAAQPLGMHGAALTRLAPERAANVRSLVATIDSDCSSFITLPGMASFYLWTGQAPPAQLYSGVWMYFLDDAQQERIVSDLKARTGVCVVKDQAVVDFWAEGRQVPRRALVEYIDSSFTPGSRFGDYELLVRR
jgi:hypothetical protein